MPTTFVKSIALTILVILQIKFTDLTILHVKSGSLPLELGLLSIISVCWLGIVGYRVFIKQFFRR